MQQLVLLIDLDYSVNDIDNQERVFIRVLASDVMGIPADILANEFKHLVTPDTAIVIVSHDIFSGEASVDSFFTERGLDNAQN